MQSTDHCWVHRCWHLLAARPGATPPDVDCPACLPPFCQDGAPVRARQPILPSLVLTLVCCFTASGAYGHDDGEGHARAATGEGAGPLPARPSALAGGGLVTATMCARWLRASAAACTSHAAQQGLPGASPARCARHAKSTGLCPLPVPPPPRGPRSLRAQGVVELMMQQGTSNVEAQVRRQPLGGVQLSGMFRSFWAPGAVLGHVAQPLGMWHSSRACDGAPGHVAQPLGGRSPWACGATQPLLAVPGPVAPPPLLQSAAFLA